jgi:hypothetical protein
MNSLLCYDDPAPVETYVPAFSPGVLTQFADQLLTPDSNTQKRILCILRLCTLAICSRGACPYTRYSPVLGLMRLGFIHLIIFF